MHKKWWTLIAVCVAIFMLLLDITIVNVALPNIQSELDTKFSDLQWVVDAYALSLAAFLLCTGALADQFGRRKLFVIGLALFTVSSLLCGLAQSPNQLIAARAAQGIGGAAMFATSLALLAQAFTGKERGTAFGIWGATTGLAVAIGPLVGGALTDAVGWEWIFLINVPIGIGAIVLTIAKVSESRNPHANKVDTIGLLTFSGALFALIYALITGNDKGWGSSEIVELLTASAILFIAFVIAELKQEHAMFDLALFRNRTFVGAAIVAFSMSASIFAMFLYLVLYLQNVLGFTPLGAGLRFLPITALSFVFAAIAGNLSERLPVRMFMGGGLLIIGVGLVAMQHWISPTSEWTAMLAGMIMCGIGIGLVNPPLASTAIGVVHPARSGVASGMNSTFRQVGIATGIAGLGAIFQHRVESEMLRRLATGPLHAHSQVLAHSVASGNWGDAIKSVAPNSQGILVKAAHASFVAGMDQILLVSALVAGIGGLLGLAMIRRTDFYVHAPTAVSVASEPAIAAD